jgi:hypothetical protein
MSADKSDDLAQAYARAHALADGDAAGPSAAVRANVLAAARAVAAEAAGRVAAEAAAPTLTPVAPPVADVGRGRARAINLSSWRVRSGAALAAMMVVGLAGWRFESTRRFDDGEQVAMAELRMAAPATTPMPQELPVPPPLAASVPYVPPPVVDAAADSARRPAAKAEARDKDVIVAQLDQRAELRERAVAPPAAAAPARRLQPAATPSPANADAGPPVSVASNAPAADAIATEQEPTLVTIKAAPTQVATAPAMPPSVLQRRVAVVPAAPAPAAKPAPQADTVVTAADSTAQRVDVEAPRAAFSSAGLGDAAKKSAPAVAGGLTAASARLLPAPLHAAADRGDLEALKKALANPSTPVDSPDATGRTALLHAVLAQQVGAVRLLLAAGADPARADQAGLTPRAAAQTGASAEIAALLAAQR